MAHNPTNVPPGSTHDREHVVNLDTRVQVNVDSRALQQFSLAEVMAALFMFNHIEQDTTVVRIYVEAGRIMAAVQHTESVDNSVEVYQSEEPIETVFDVWDQVDTYVFSNNRWVHQQTVEIREP